MPHLLSRYEPGGRRFEFLSGRAIFFKEFAPPKEALIKSIRGEPVEPRADKSPAIYGISRSPFDELRAERET
jgi:hypothetical protein